MLGIFLAIALIMVLAYKGWSTIWISPIAAAVVALLGGMSLLETYKGAYMTGFVGYTVQWFPVFMLGAIFGKLMDCTLMAKSVALSISKLIGPKFAVLAVVLAGSILTYGGVSMFVAVFCLYPLALVLYREANIPRRLIPAAVTVGVFAYTMVCLPGTPQIQNLIPGRFFGTSPMAAPILGIICGILMGGSGTLYVMWREKVYKARGEHFTEPATAAPEDPNERLPNIWLSLLPLVVVVVTLNVFKWDIIISLLTSIALILVLNFRKFRTFVNAINEGAKGSMMPIINVSAIVGFGAVVRAAPAFSDLVKLVTSIPGSPLVSLAIAVNVLCGATGSASGGLSITLEALAPEYIQIAARDGIPLEVMHRIAAIAASAMDTVPHNGAILTLLAVTGMSHKESYFDISITTIVIPLIVTAIGIVLASIGIV
jgi:H+/gluconate symporter-like permease